MIEASIGVPTLPIRHPKDRGPAADRWPRDQTPVDRPVWPAGGGRAFTGGIEVADMASKEALEVLEVDAVLVRHRPGGPISKDLKTAAWVQTRRLHPGRRRPARWLANATVAHLWAVGDVTGKMIFAHTAAAQGLWLL